MSVLTDETGLPMATAAAGDEDPTTQLAAVVPLVRHQVERSNEWIGLSDAREIIVNHDDGTRLVSRFFSVGDRSFILACVVPDKKPYRRAMNKAITAIKRLWSAVLSSDSDDGD